MRPRQTPKPNTAFAWLTTQKGGRLIAEFKVCDEDQAVMFRLWEPNVWRTIDRMPFGMEIGDEIELPDPALSLERLPSSVVRERDDVPGREQTAAHLPSVLEELGLL